MKKSCLAVTAYFALSLCPQNAAWGETPANDTAEVTAAADDDLLMFYEENELVTATRRTTSLRRAPAIASIITAAEIRNMGARNLMDVLKTVPSIGVSIDEFGRSLVEVRGVRTLTSEKILLMLDGHKLNDAWSGSAIANVYNDLPVENIRQVEIVKGPGSALYGSNAFVAVINVVTKDADDIDGVEVKAAGGSYGTGKVNLTGGKVFGKLTVAASGDYLSSDGARLLVPRDSLSSTALNSAAPGTTSQQLERGDFFLKASLGDWSLMGQYVNKSRGANIGINYALTGLDNLRYENYWSELAYKHAFSDTLSVKIRGYFDQFVLDSKIGFLPPAATPAFPGGMYATTQLVDRNIGTELQLDYDVFAGNHAILGFMYENISQFDVKLLANFNPLNNAPLGSYRDVSSSANFNKDAGRDVYALYLQDEWELLPALRLTAGGRYDHYSDFGYTINPRVGVVWGINEQAELKLLYGRAFRAPNFKELYDQNNNVSIGNPNLKPEEIDTYEAGLGYAFAKLKLNLGYFFSKIDNMIDRDTTVTPTRYINKGKAEIHGLEAGAAAALSAQTLLRVGYLHQETRDTANDRSLAWVPNNRLTASLDQELGRYLHARADVLWTGRRPRPVGDPRSDSSPYTTVDLTIVAHSFIDNLELTGTVRNLFDERQSDPDTSGELNRIPGDLPKEGISGFVSAMYRF